MLIRTRACLAMIAATVGLLGCRTNDTTSWPAEASANRYDDYTSKWIESTDLAHLQQHVAASMGMDNDHKVLYLNDQRSFRCINGSAANGNVLIAIYDAGNTLGKAAGSGWYVSELDAAICGVPKAGGMAAGSMPPAV